MFSFGTSFTAVLLSLAAFILAGGDPSILTPNLDQKLVPVKSQHLPVQNGVDGRMYMDINVNGKKVKVVVDTAASHSVLSARDAKFASVETNAETRIITAGGQSDAKVGTAASIKVVENNILNHRILVVDDLPVSILGVDVLKKMNGYYISF